MRLITAATIVCCAHMSVLCAADATVLASETENAAVTPAWKLAPQPVALRAADSQWAIPLNIAVMNHATVHALRLAPVELIEESTTRALAGGRLALCPSPQPCNGTPIELNAPGATLWLTPLQQGKTVYQTWPGKYRGAVTVVSLDRPEGETVAIGLSVTGWGWQLSGAGLIAVGMALSYVLTTLLRHRIGRMELMLPAVELRRAIDDLRARLVDVKVYFAPREIERKLDGADAALQEEKLMKVGLPSEMPGFLQKPAANTGDLVNHIAIQRSWIEVLGILIDEGMTKLIDLHSQYLRRYGNEPTDSPFDDAFRKIDMIAARNTAPAVDALRIEVVALLEPLQGELQQHTATTRGAISGLPFAPHKPAHLLRDPVQLRHNIARENRNGWIFLFLLTVIAGYYLLVLKEPGFGTPRDLFQCLLWGVGLPSGTVAASSTIGSISSTYTAAHPPG